MKEKINSDLPNCKCDDTFAVFMYKKTWYNSKYKLRGDTK